MIRNYLRIAYRNLLKNKLYSLMNIFGLALGMAACFFIFQYVHFESSYDGFNKNASDIYRIPISYSGSMSNVPTTAANHPAVGPAMKSEFPEVKDFTRVVNVSLFINASTISYKGPDGVVKTFNEENMYMADASFFSIFTYPFLSGNPINALKDANTVVLTESMARKYFGKINPIGQTLNLNGQLLLKVTGVIKDVPENSHLKFNLLISFATLGPKWGNDVWIFPEFYNYVLLKPGTDPKKIQAQFPAFIEKHLGKVMKDLNFRCAFEMQPLTDIHLTSNYLKEAEANGSEKEINFLSIIGIFILVIAWINYINLSTAKSMERAKEVGLRKVVGAAKGQLIGQFLFESIFINILAVVLATGFILISSPFFHGFLGKDITTGFFSSGLGSKPMFWLLVLATFLSGSLFVGAYPAFIISSYKPAPVLKGMIFNTNKGISLRRVLVCFQFVLSIILIAGTFIVFRQLDYMRQENPGYNRDQIMIIKTPAIVDSTIPEKYRYFKTEVLKNTSIVNIATSSDIPGRTIRYRNSVRKENQDKTFNFTTYLLEIDDRFMNTYNVELLAGRNFTDNEKLLTFKDKNTRVLINEEIVKALGFKSPQDAVNKRIIFVLGTNEYNSEVIGVVKNYHQRSFKEKYDPILCYYPFWTDWKYFSVNVNVNNLDKNIASIEKLYTSSFPGNPFEYFFLDDFFNQQYQSDQRLGNVFGLFTGLAIIVACLGLLGLSSFVIKLRTKEIGIRKVLGASILGILLLFSKDFIRLVFFASLIAIPIIYFAADRWLANYAFHINPGWLFFLLPCMLLLVISLLTICIQSLRAALSNPIKSLRSE